MLVFPLSSSFMSPSRRQTQLRLLESRRAARVRRREDCLKTFNDNVLDEDSSTPLVGQMEIASIEEPDAGPLTTEPTEPILPLLERRSFSIPESGLVTRVPFPPSVLGVSELPVHPIEDNIAISSHYDPTSTPHQEAHLFENFLPKRTAVLTHIFPNINVSFHQSLLESSSSAHGYHRKLFRRRLNCKKRFCKFISNVAERINT